MKFNNYNGKWDWSVFWLHGIIGFIVGFLFWFVRIWFIFDDCFKCHVIDSSVVGLVFFLLAGVFGDRFWNRIKGYLL